MWRIVVGCFCLPGLCLLALAAQVTPDGRGEGVIDLSHTLNARMHPVPVSAVSLTDGFWAARRRTTIERSLPSLLALLEEHGVVDNFRRAAGKKNVPRKGRNSTDTDLYKWIEAASWALASPDTAAPDKQKIQTQLKPLIVDVLAAQDADGYLDTFYPADRTHLRFSDLAHSQEDYCLGHLLQAGIAYYRATGNRRLLDAGIRFADYVLANFGPSKKPFVTGHPVLEMALVELYRTTGESKYLDFARYLLSGVERDRLRLKEADVRYMFSGKPFTSHTEFEGHAVRALYAASGATDYFAESGDPAYKRTLDTLWTDLTTRKMYITGGVGSRSQGESFGDAYELPSGSAYAETCASVANVMWNFRMLAITGDARYTDVLERALYNGANAGMSLNGTLYCYRNPLAAAASEKLRNPWYDVTCCPPNIERLFTSLPGYFYATSRDGVYVNLYNDSEMNWHLEDGTELKIVQSTRYPWSGEVKFTLYPAKPSQFTLHLRWPSWASSADIMINGNRASGDFQRGSYIPLTRTWSDGDVISLNLPIQTVPVVANPRSADLYGRVAIERGPLVYALEQADQNGISIPDIFIRPAASSTAEFHKELLGGVTLVKFPGSTAEKNLGEQPLYEPFGLGFFNRNRRPITLTFIPYYAWSNREPGAMEVWVPFARGPEASPGGASGGGDRHSSTK